MGYLARRCGRKPAFSRSAETECCVCFRRDLLWTMLAVVVGPRFRFPYLSAQEKCCPNPRHEGLSPAQRYVRTLRSAFVFANPCSSCLATASL